MTDLTFRGMRADLEGHERVVTDKIVSAEEAVSIVHDGDHVAIGGTLYSRTPMALVFALLRAQRKHLTLSRPLTCYEAELFLVTGAADRIITSWMGIGLRWGLSPVLRHFVENGLAEYEEWSHLAMGLRYKAGAMGVPFLPTLTMLGSDVARERKMRTVTCPYTTEEVGAVPALGPDVALIHVHRADKYGNAQVDGYHHMDLDMARASRRVIVSAEEIVSTYEIQRHAASTVLPHFAVDAVVEARFGAYPHECYGLYEADVEHFDDYVQMLRANGMDGARQYVKQNVSDLPDFKAFLDLAGEDRIQKLVESAKGLMVP